jgi:hypothetical protein
MSANRITNEDFRVPTLFAEQTTELGPIGAGFFEGRGKISGARMLEPGSAFNLRNFPHDQRERFISSITRGKNQPPWGDFFKPEQLEGLWAYVVAGERR